MSRAPNRRDSGHCNDKNLQGIWATVIKGYDMAVDTIDRLFDNLEAYPELKRIMDPDADVVSEDKTKILRETVADWMEFQRNTIVTIFLDHQYAEEERTK